MKIKVENLKPVADRVVIRAHEKESKTAAGVHKPEDAKKNNHILTGEVVAVGPGTPDCPMGLKKGESVLYPEHVGTEISDGLTIIKESQILTVI
jgi:chaperonin GroES